MACDHKFQQYLNIEHIDFEPTTLIVGTFNPMWPDSNPAKWFYGRTANNYFWDVLPRLYDEESLTNATPNEWKQFCHDKRIAITDLISSIDDTDPTNPIHIKVLAGYADNAIVHNFDDFLFVNIVQILRRHPTIRNVYFTRGIGETFWRHLWNPVMHHCYLNNLRERKLLTPSGDAVYQHGVHNTENPDDVIHLLQDYILRRWRLEWHF